MYNHNALLVYHLLVSIRMDFSDDSHSALKERHALALKLARAAADEYEWWACNEGIYEKAQKYGAYAEMMKKLVEVIKGFVPGHTDGRYFRDEFPGGYINMLETLGMENK